MAVAALTLGVGWAHETLFTRGITERALDWVRAPLRIESAWFVDEVTSVITLWGEPSDVRHAFSLLVQRLNEGPTALPPAQITRPRDPDHELLRLRYGHQAYGLGGAARYGHQSTDPAAVAWWLGHVGSNTTRIATSEVDIDASSLTERTALFEPSRVEMVSTPGVWISPEGLGFSWLADTTPTSALATELMIAALAEAVPDPGPTLESVQLTIRSIGLDATHQAVVATDTKTSTGGANTALAGLLRLCTEGPDVAEIITAIERYERRQALSPLNAALRVARTDLLTALEYAVSPGGELTTDPEALMSEVQRQCDTLLMTCSEQPAAAQLARSVRTNAPQPASGQKYRPRLAMTESGMSQQGHFEADDLAMSFRGSEIATVSAQHLVLVERFPDGERTAYHRDGQELFVDPLLWKKSAELITWIDRHGGAVAIDRVGRLTPDPFVVRAALRARPGIAAIGGVMTAIVGLTLMIAAIALPDDRAFKAVFGVLLLGGSGLIFKLLADLKVLAKRIQD